jgi:hypothetical protein
VYNSLWGQDNTSSIKNGSIKESVNTILIIEPALQRNVPAIRNIILNTIKKEIDGLYDSQVLRLDSVIDVMDGKYVLRFEAININHTDFKYILASEHHFIQMNTEIVTGYVDTNYESRITLSLFDKQGNLILRSTKDTSRLPMGTRNNPLKILERATERAISEIIEKISILDK